MYELDHSDLVNLICGLQWNYDVMSFLCKNDLSGLYTYCGGFNDDFNWNRSEVCNLNNMELYSLYLSLKKVLKTP